MKADGTKELEDGYRESWASVLRDRGLGAGGGDRRRSAELLVAMRDVWPETTAPAGCSTISATDCQPPVVAPAVSSWTVGTPPSRPGRKANNCCLSGGTDGVSPAGPQRSEGRA